MFNQVLINSKLYSKPLFEDLGTLKLLCNSHEIYKYSYFITIQTCSMYSAWAVHYLVDK